MKVTWLAANGAWGITMGGGSLIDIDGRRLFATLNEVKSVLAPKGLALRGRTVTVLDIAA